MGTHVQRGVVGCCHIEDYERDLIRKHEKTRQDKEDDRTRHTDIVNANTGQVFLFFRDDGGKRALFEKVLGQTPEYDFTSEDGVRNMLWRAKETGDIARAFGAVPALYIADGHHWAAAASRALQELGGGHGGAESAFFLAVIFPKSHMRIMPYNRVVADLHGLSGEQFLTLLGERFRIETCETEMPAQIRQFSMYMDGRWHILHALPGSFPEGDPVRSLDVSILQNNLLGPILGIDDPRTSKRINFIGGIRGSAELVRLVDSGKYAVAFSLHATTMDQLLSVASSGNVMPPKSTWFEPKLRSGLVIHVL
jgi:uncharacterized protein (DUF1015 family)